MAMNWSEEKIAAAVDGSLDGPEAEVIRRAMDEDPEARRYADELRRLNDTLRDAFNLPSDDPMPAPIAAAIFGGENTVTLARRAIRRPLVWLPASIAACLAIVVAAAFYSSTGDRGIAPMAAVGDAAAEGGPLHLALEGLPSGSTSPDGVRPMLTFLDLDGRPCREFEVDRGVTAELSQGIACRGGDGRWHVEALVTASVAVQDGAGYAPASGPGGNALEAATKALGSGRPLAPGEESSLIASGWNTQR